jgi:hypothetical protein
MKKIILNIGGQDREFHFGIGFIGLFLETSGLRMDELNKIDENPFKFNPILMFCSLSYAVKRKNEIPDFDLYDVNDWIDESDGTAVIAFKNAFIESMTKDVPKNDAKTTEEPGK